MDLLNQPDYLDGQLVHVGGETESVQVHFREEGTTHRCTTNREMAKSLAPFLDGPPLRAFGTATWIRHPDGRWQLQSFLVENFMPLENKTLAEALSEFEDLPSPDWHHNPLKDLDIDWKA